MYGWYVYIETYIEADGGGGKELVQTTLTYEKYKRARHHASEPGHDESLKSDVIAVKVLEVWHTEADEDVVRVEYADDEL